MRLRKRLAHRPEGAGVIVDHQLAEEPVRRGGRSVNGEIERFLSQQGKRWSPNTVFRYGWYLRNFARWAEDEYGRLEPGKITERVLLRWLDARMHWAPTTQYVATVSLRNFFRWLVGRELSPAEKLPLPRRPLTPQRTLDEPKLERLLAAQDTSTPKGIRDTAILLVLLDSGLRSSELCHLRTANLDLQARSFTCRIKGGKWATGVFSEYTASALAEWLRVRPSVASADVDALFVGIGGNTRGRPLTRDGLRCVLRQIGQKAGVLPVSPHDFRRTFATMALRAGAPSRLVQVAGRWSSLDMVERYSQTIVARDLDPYSPVDRLMGLREAPEEE